MEVLGHYGWTGARSSPIPRTNGQPPARIGFDFQGWIRDREAAFADRTGTQRIADLEHAILVSATAGRSARDLEVHIAGLRELAHSAGVDIIDVVTQNRSRVDPKTVLTSDKLDEFVIRAFQSDVDLLIVDQDLTPTQARNLGERMELRMIEPHAAHPRHLRATCDHARRQAAGWSWRSSSTCCRGSHSVPRSRCRGSPAASADEALGSTRLAVERRRTRDRVTRLECEVKKLAGRHGRRRGRWDGAPARRRRGVRAPSRQPAQAAGAGRRDALGGRRGSSESLALTFESATELPRGAPDNGGTTAWKSATSEQIAACAAPRGP